MMRRLASQTNLHDAQDHVSVGGEARAGSLSEAFHRLPTIAKLRTLDGVAVHVLPLTLALPAEAEAEQLAAKSMEVEHTLSELEASATSADVSDEPTAQAADPHKALAGRRSLVRQQSFDSASHKSHQGKKIKVNPATQVPDRETSPVDKEEEPVRRFKQVSKPRVPQANREAELKKVRFFSRWFKLREWGRRARLWVTKMVLNIMRHFVVLLVLFTSKRKLSWQRRQKRGVQERTIGLSSKSRTP